MCEKSLRSRSVASRDVMVNFVIDLTAEKMIQIIFILYRPL